MTEDLLPNEDTGDGSIFTTIDKLKKEICSLSNTASTAAMWKQMVMYNALKKYFFEKENAQRMHIRRPAMSTSLRIARGLGKGPHFARKLRYTAAYLSKHGMLPVDHRRQKGPILSWLDNEIVLQKIKLYLATLQHGELNTKSFQNHICTHILPSFTMTEGDVTVSTEIALSTVRRWMRKLGYECSATKKGVYVDGHECPDVQEYRNKFLKNMENYEK